jgi:hypothetical protein
MESVFKPAYTGSLCEGFKCLTFTVIIISSLNFASINPLVPSLLLEVFVQKRLNHLDYA